jgi:hypothetical protein
MREKIEFLPNTPVIVTMEHNSGKPVPNTRTGGTQYQYFLQGEKIMYAEPEVWELITANRIKAGDTVEICKRQRRIGQQDRVDWEVVQVPSQPDYAHAEPQGQTGDFTMAEWQARRPPTAAAAAPQLLSQPRPATQQQQPAATIASMTQQMANAFFSAIDAANVAEAYAQERSRRLILDADAIRAMAITIFIEGAKK